MTSRYPDNRDNRYQRDRTPPRNYDRRVSVAPPYGSSYIPRNNEPSRASEPGNNFPHSARDVPRGPKSLSGVGSGPGVPSGPREPRGRGVTQLRDMPPLSETRDRWQRIGDRDRDFRDRRSPPRRSPIRDSRDYHGLPQVDIGRARRNSRDGPPSAGSNFSDPPLSSQSYRGGGFRGRGRGGPEWEFPRGRGRPAYDDRDQRDHFRPRSPSRGPLRREREPIRDDRDIDRREDRRFDRNEPPRRGYDSYKGPASALDARNIEPRHVPPTPESRHIPPASSSTGSAFPPSFTGPAHRPVSDRVGAPEPGRDDSYSRRSSIAIDSPVKEPRRESDKAEFIAGRAESNRDRYGPRAASPAPQVPAFGSVSARPPYPAQASNVWRNPNLDKPPQSLIAKPTPSTSAPPATAPVPPASSTIPKPPTGFHSLGLGAVPPTGPKAQRVPDRAIIDTKANVEQPRTDSAPRVIPNAPSTAAPEAEQRSPVPIQTQSPAGIIPQSRAPPIGPQASLRPNAPPAQPYARPPQAPFAARDVSPNALPIGPRGSASVNTSPKSVATNIPTGPRAERGQPMAARPPIFGAPDRPAFAPPRNQWIRQQGPPPLPFGNRPPVIPSKREFGGDDRDRIAGTVPKTPRIDGTTSASDSRPWEASRPEPPTPADQARRDLDASLGSGPEPRTTEASPHVAKLETRRLSDVSMTDASSKTEAPPLSAASSAPDAMYESENDTDLDESDFAESLAKYNKDKATMEAKLIDVSAPEYRANTPLEEIALLSALSSLPIEQLSIGGLEAMEVEMASPEPAVDPSAPLQQPLTPKADDLADADDAEDVEVTREGTNSDPLPLRPYRSYSIDRDSTPDISTLPYLAEGPLTPLSDPEELSTLHEDIFNAVRDVLLQTQDTEMKKHESDEEQYACAYREWRQRVQELDEEKEQNKGEAREQSVEPAMKATTPDVNAASAMANLLEQPIRRGHRFNSEYELQLALKESMKDAEEAQARKERDAKKAAPDPEREATIPDQYTPAEADRRHFRDTNWLRQPGQGINVFHYEPQPDDFTEEEHRILVQNYHGDYSKKWGKLAEIITMETGRARDYKECINHYYATKWSKEYKSKRKYQRRVKKPRGGGGAGRGRASAAHAERPDMSIDDANNPLQSQMLMTTTDSGRPRRAAAPTFGAESEVDGATPAPTPARARGNTRQDNGDGTAEKTGKRQKMTKERGGRKTKNQPLVAASAGSPAKIDRKEKLLGVKTEDVYGRERSIEDSQMLSNIQPGPGMEDHVSYTEDMLARNGPSGILNERPRIQTAHSRVGPSSYWSVMEQTDFKRNVAHFGTDFVAIANHMGTKTHTMVKNQYQRIVENGSAPELIQAATEADQRRLAGEDLGPPPTPTPAAKRRYDNPQATVPRTIAPTPDVVDLINSPVSQPTILTQSSPPIFPASGRYSSIAQAAPVPAKQAGSAQSPGQTIAEGGPHITHASQPPAQPAQSHQHHHHHQQHQAQRPSLSGPRAGYFSENRAEPRPPSQPSSVSQSIRPMSHIQGPLHGHQPSQEPTFRQSVLAQEREMQARFESQREQERDYQARYQQQQHQQQHSRRISQDMAQRQYQAHSHSTSQIMAQLRSEHATHGSPEARALSVQPSSMYPPQQQQQQQQSIMQHLIDTPSENPVGAHHMPTRPSVPTPPPKEEPRQYPMPPQLPLSQSAPPAPRPAQEPRKSNLLSILNPEPSEPEEPRPRKNVSDQGGPSHTSTPLQNHPVAPPPPASQPPRREPFGDSVANQPPFSRPQYGQQQPQPQPPASRQIVDLTGRDPPVSVRPRESWPPRQAFQAHTQPPTSQTSSPHPAHPHPTSIVTDSRLFPNHRAAAFGQHNTGRHVPSPPPAFTHSPHSRTSSFTHAAPPQSRHHTPLQAAQAGAGAAQILAPNPYGQIDPPSTTPQPQGPGGMRPSPHLLTSQLQQQQQRELQARQEQAQQAQHHNASLSYSNPPTPADVHPHQQLRNVLRDRDHDYAREQAEREARHRSDIRGGDIIQRERDHLLSLRDREPAHLREHHIRPDARFSTHTPGPQERSSYAGPPQPPRTGTPLSHNPHQSIQHRPALSHGGLVVDHNHVILGQRQHPDEQRYRERDERMREELARRDEERMREGHERRLMEGHERRLREENLRREELFRRDRERNLYAGGGVGAPPPQGQGQQGGQQGQGPLDWTRPLGERGGR